MLADEPAGPVFRTAGLTQMHEFRRALTHGVRAVALGCSIKETFGGCFGDGCEIDRDQTAWWHTILQTSRSNATRMGTSERHVARGFLSSFMRKLNATFPHPRHSLLNRGRSGSLGTLENSCLQSFVPADTNLVFLDFALGDPLNNGAQLTIYDEVDLPRALNLSCLPYCRRHHFSDGPPLWSQLMAKLLSRPRPPLVLFLLNVFWCRKADGTDARLGLSDNANEAKQERLRWCAQPSASLANSHNATLQFLRPFARLSARCGQAALSAYYELAPRVLSGALNLSQVSRDGNHPTSRSEKAELNAAWVRVLVGWMQRVAAAPAPHSTPTTGVESRAAVQPTQLAQRGGVGIARCGSQATASTEGACYGFSAKLWRPPIARADGWHFVVDERLRAGYSS